MRSSGAYRHDSPSFEHATAEFFIIGGYVKDRLNSVQRLDLHMRTAPHPRRSSAYRTALRIRLFSKRRVGGWAVSIGNLVIALGGLDGSSRHAYGVLPELEDARQERERRRRRQKTRVVSETTSPLHGG